MIKTYKPNYQSIVLFDSGNAYGFFYTAKLSMRKSGSGVFEKLEGVFTKEILKIHYPNTSIRLANKAGEVTRFEKESLKGIYRVEKILKLLKNE